jgi:hypothetical protein
MYFSYVRPILEYADVIWDNCPNYIKEKLEHINYEAARIITGATKLTSIRILLQECGMETLEERRNKHKILLFHKMVNKTVPNIYPILFHPPSDKLINIALGTILIYFMYILVQLIIIIAVYLQPFDSGTNLQRISKVMFQSIP